MPKLRIASWDLVLIVALILVTIVGAVTIEGVSSPRFWRFVTLEAIPILLFGLGGVLLVLVPFLDRRVSRDGRSPVFTVIGIVALVYIVGMTAWGYRSWVPVIVVLVTGALVGILGLGTGGRGGATKP